MDKIIINTSTRVIKRVTVDENPSISDGESIVESQTKIDLSGSSTGFWKLNDKNEKVEATKEEIDLTFPVMESAQSTKITNLREALDSVLNDPNADANIKNVFQQLKDLTS